MSSSAENVLQNERTESSENTTTVDGTGRGSDSDKVPDLTITSPTTTGSESSTENEKFHPALHCAVNLEKSDADKMEIQMEESGGQTGTTESDVTESIDELRRITFCDVCSMFCSAYNNRIERISNSPFAVVFYFVLFLMPVSAAVIGGMTHGNCPMSPSSPILVFMIGLTGFIGLSVRLILTTENCARARPRRSFVPNAINSTCYILILVLLATEMLLFSRMEPSEDSSSLRYCDPTFYSYTFWMNWITLALLSIFAVLYFPGWFRRDERSFDVTTDPDFSVGNPNAQYRNF